MADKFEVPDLETRLSRDFFADHPIAVAQNLLGKTVVRQFPDNRVIISRIKEVYAWKGSEDSSSEVTEYEPGFIGISQKYGQNLIDISTEAKNRSSCITLAALNSPDGIVQGPGKVSTYLHIDKMFDYAPIDHPALWVGGETAERSLVKVRSKSNMPENFRGAYYIK